MPQETRNLVGPMGVKYGLAEPDRRECVQRMCGGMDSYGPTNHLQPEFDWIGECLQELHDAFNMAGPMANRRARLAQMGKLPLRDIVGNEQNPVWESLCKHIAVSIRLARQLQQQQAALLGKRGSLIAADRNRGT